jgi:hypothetical protein
MIYQSIEGMGIIYMWASLSIDSRRFCKASFTYNMITQPPAYSLRALLLSSGSSIGIAEGRGMIFFKSLAVLLITLGLVGLVSAALRQTATTSEWQSINVDGLFSFRLPREFTKTEKKGVESRLGEYYRGRTRFLFIWGGSASPAYGERRQPGMGDYQEVTTRLRGKRANIRTYWQLTGDKRIYHAELNIGNWEKGQVELYMGLESNDPASLETANQIFRSVVIPIPDPESAPSALSSAETTALTMRSWRETIATTPRALTGTPILGGSKQIV